MKKILLLTALTAAAWLHAAITVQNVTAQQRWPWNGLVDIDYEVVCNENPNADVWVYPLGFDHDRNISIAPRTLTGAGANSSVKPGKHRMTWDAKTDEPNFHSSSFTMTMHGFANASRYMVVDLSNGPADGMFYPVRYTNDPPDLSNDTCRTTELWLRLILPGTFMMGSPSTELGRADNEDLHQVTLTKPFYIGIFEVTQKQYQLVMNQTPSTYKGTNADVRPLDLISRDSIIGDFLPTIRKRTGISGFNLPAEAQWEYACRAGTSTALNSGKELTQKINCSNMAEVGRYTGNGGSSYQHAKVGSYLPNAWGLYDMHGNISEWCLDAYIKNLGTTELNDPTNLGNTGSTLCVIRGGNWHNSNGAQTCRSASRGNASSNSSNYYSGYYYGFRLLAVPPVQ